MTIALLDAVVIFVIAWFAVLSGVALGGHLVFRSSMPNSGRLFRLKQDGTEGASIIDDGMGTEELGADDVPEKVMSQNERFKSIFKANLED